MFARMPKLTKTKRLRDSYRFPGFHPALTVVGLFGDPHARVIRLTRRSKKPCAGYVVAYNGGGTTVNCVGSEISPVVVCVSTLRLISVESIAGAAKG
jgi:hypothetical protein